MTAHAILSPLGPLSRVRVRTFRSSYRPRRSPAETQFNRYLLDVDFEAPDGERWFAVGGGETIEEALAVAREMLPAGAGWEVVRWSHVHGE